MEERQDNMNCNLKKEDVIVLDDNKEYVVVNLAIYENNNYAFLCELNNADNIKFVQLEEQGRLSIINGDEVELIKNLIFLFSNNLD